MRDVKQFGAGIKWSVLVTVLALLAAPAVTLAGKADDELKKKIETLTISMCIYDTPLEEAVSVLKELTGIGIEISPAAMKTLDREQTANLEFRQNTIAQALDLMLAGYGDLKYVIEDGSIIIVPGKPSGGITKETTEEKSTSDPVEPKTRVAEGEAVRGLMLTIWTEREIFAAGEPVVLTVRAKNVGKSTIHIYDLRDEYGRPAMWYNIFLTDGNGKRIRWRYIQGSKRFGRQKRKLPEKLEPGKSIEGEIHLTDHAFPAFFKTLTITCEYDTTIRDGSSIGPYPAHNAWKGKAVSNTVKITQKKPAEGYRGLACSLSVDRQNLKAGEDIPCTITLKNVGSGEILLNDPDRYSESKGRKTFEVLLRVRAIGGDEITHHEFSVFRSASGKMSVPVKLKPGESLAFERKLSAEKIRNAPTAFEVWCHYMNYWKTTRNPETGEKFEPWTGSIFSEPVKVTTTGIEKE